MNVTDKVFEMLDALAKKLGVAAEFLFGAVVKQMFVEGIVWSAIILAVFITALIFTVKSGKSLYAKVKTATEAVKAEMDKKGTLYGFQKEEIEERYYNSMDIVLFLIPALILFFSFLSVCFGLPDQLMRVANPEYYAIKEIMNMVTGGGK